ncbi:unnamed protein product [Staurois parvus]|uniref:Transposase Tc1-like domain-containing protein n=1 Tax=Staurois parvus TaxID=386267 RepID=A0ABN9DDG5_9NEOB|nr:unnamed protein product [Staurois parvus]
MQTASTNICERLCNKPICEISLLLNIPRSTVSGIIKKWKQLGTTATQPPSGRPRKMTEWTQPMLKRTVLRSHQLSAESIAKDLQTSCGLQISTTTVCIQLHGMGFLGQAAAFKPTKPSTMQSIGCSGVKHAATGL